MGGELTVKNYEYRRKNLADVLPEFVPNWSAPGATVPTVHTETADVTGVVTCDDSDRPALDSYLDSTGWIFVQEIP